MDMIDNGAYNRDFEWISVLIKAILYITNVSDPHRF